MDKNRSNYGDIIREERVSKNLSQEELAKLCIMSVSRIRGYESGKTKPNNKTFNAILEALARYENKKLEDKVEKIRVNLDSDANDAKRDTVEENNQHESENFNGYMFSSCCRMLEQGCTKVKEHLVDSNSINEECVELVKSSILNHCNSIEFSIKRSLKYSVVVDPLISTFIIKECLNNILESFNCIKSIENIISLVNNDNSMDKKLLGDLAYLVRSCLHSLKFIIDYINDFFVSEFETVLVIPKPQGKIGLIFGIEILEGLMNEESEKAV